MSKGILLTNPTAWGLILEMICQTSTQLSLEGVEGKQELQQSPQPQESTVVSEADRKAKKKIYDKAYTLANLEKKRARGRAYSKATLEKQKYYKREWRKRNAEKLVAKFRAFSKSPEGRAEHERLLEYNKKRRRVRYLRDREQTLAREKTPELRKRKKELARVTRKEWLEKNPGYYSKYDKARRAVDPVFAITLLIRSAVRRIFRTLKIKKNSRTGELVACTFIHLKNHIESQFTGDMSWENRSVSFEIDHHVPLSAFNLLDEEELKCACNWKNLSPLPPLQNSVKSDKIPAILPSWIPAHIAARIEKRRP